MRVRVESWERARQAADSDDGRLEIKGVAERAGKSEMIPSGSCCLIPFVSSMTIACRMEGESSQEKATC